MIYKPTILVVDDDASLCDVLTDILEEASYRVITAGNGSDAVELFKKEECSVVLLDLLLPGLNGLEILDLIKEVNPACPVIMMSGHGTIQSAVTATQQGAFDWLEKPLDKDRILITVRNAVEQTILVSERDYFRDEIKEKYKMVGCSKPMQAVYNLIDKVAATKSTVLISGESGTGKDLAARAIHHNSSRAARPFIEFNCAAVPETLIESELFGHLRGAFTGAHRDKKGRFQLADGGTLFLDEIGDLSVMAQAKVLRALETGEVTPVGSEETHTVDVRFITATNKDLAQLTSENLFREDLFHRINVIAVNLPPLRKRPEDIPAIFTHFLETLAGENSCRVKTLSPQAEMILLSHDWPGNVRELRNIAEKAVVLIDDAIINGQHLAELLGKQRPLTDNRSSKTFQNAKREFERNYLMRMLDEYEWHISDTARALDMSRSLLYKKMEQYGIRGVG